MAQLNSRLKLMVLSVLLLQADVIAATEQRLLSGAEDQTAPVPFAMPVVYTMQS